jgi:bifunctional UDP-N-acetylglucosamine pyrophosphorylase/glucosamine-1-phosphate N-acetyltransferase
MCSTHLRCVRRWRIGTDNAQNEKYLTDAAAGIQHRWSHRGGTGHDHRLVAGINDRAQLGVPRSVELNARIVRAGSCVA